MDGKARWNDDDWRWNMDQITISEGNNDPVESGSKCLERTPEVDAASVAEKEGSNDQDVTRKKVNDTRPKILNDGSVGGKEISEVCCGDEISDEGTSVNSVTEQVQCEDAKRVDEKTRGFVNPRSRNTVAELEDILEAKSPTNTAEETGKSDYYKSGNAAQALMTEGLSCEEYEEFQDKQKGVKTLEKDEEHQLAQKIDGGDKQERRQNHEGVCDGTSASTRKVERKRERKGKNWRTDNRESGGRRYEKETEHPLKIHLHGANYGSESPVSSDCPGGIQSFTKVDEQSSARVRERQPNQENTLDSKLFRNEAQEGEIKSGHAQGTCDPLSLPSPVSLSTTRVISPRSGSKAQSSISSESQPRTSGSTTTTLTSNRWNDAAQGRRIVLLKRQTEKGQDHPSFAFSKHTDRTYSATSVEEKNQDRQGNIEAPKNTSNGVWCATTFPEEGAGVASDKVNGVASSTRGEFEGMWRSTSSSKYKNRDVSRQRGEEVKITGIFPRSTVSLQEREMRYQKLRHKILSGGEGADDLLSENRRKGEGNSQGGSDNAISRRGCIVHDEDEAASGNAENGEVYDNSKSKIGDNPELACIKGLKWSQKCAIDSKIDLHDPDYRRGILPKANFAVSSSKTDGTLEINPQGRPAGCDVSVDLGIHFTTASAPVHDESNVSVKHAACFPSSPSPSCFPVPASAGQKPFSYFPPPPPPPYPAPVASFRYPNSHKSNKFRPHRQKKKFDQQPAETPQYPTRHCDPYEGQSAAVSNTVPTNFIDSSNSSSISSSFTHSHPQSLPHPHQFSPPSSQYTYCQNYQAQYLTQSQQCNASHHGAPPPPLSASIPSVAPSFRYTGENTGSLICSSPNSPSQPTISFSTPPSSLCSIVESCDGGLATKDGSYLSGKTSVDVHCNRGDADTDPSYRFPFPHPSLPYNWALHSNDERFDCAALKTDNSHSFEQKSVNSSSSSIIDGTGWWNNIPYTTTSSVHPNNTNFSPIMMTAPHGIDTGYYYCYPQPLASIPMDSTFPSFSSPTQHFSSGNYQNNMHHHPSSDKQPDNSHSLPTEASSDSPQKGNNP